MFMGSTNTFSAKKILKLCLTILFIYLKIILLQYFQFLIFSNKWYPNRLYIVCTKKIYYVYSIYVSIIFQQYRFLVAYIVLAKNVQTLLSLIRYYCYLTIFQPSSSNV